MKKSQIPLSYLLKSLRIREREDRGLIIKLSSLQSFIITSSYSLAHNFGDFSKFWLVGSKMSVQTFQPLIFIYRRGNFHHWGFTVVYRHLSYPFRSLIEKATGMIMTLKPNLKLLFLCDTMWNCRKNREKQWTIN